MAKLLYVYEERIPEKLKELVLSYIPKDEFEIDFMTYKTSEEEQKKKLQNAELVLFAPGRFLSDEILEYGKNIKLMQLWSSGYDKFNIEGSKKYGIRVSNNGGANASAVAEHAVLLMLAVYKKLPDSHERTVAGNWKGNSHGLDMFKIEGKTVGILGFGNIGRCVAKKLYGFEPKIIYHDIKRADPNIEKELNAEFVSMEELLSRSDILSLHLHSTDQTKNIIGNKEFDLMKKGAILVNVSRAQLVDQEALVENLKSGKLLGAGVDVYIQEPTSGDEELLKLPNVVATPHMAGSTRDTYEFVMERIIDNFRRVVAGEKPMWVVNGI